MLLGDMLTKKMVRKEDIHIGYRANRIFPKFKDINMDLLIFGVEGHIGNVITIS